MPPACGAVSSEASAAPGPPRRLPPSRRELARLRDEGHRAVAMEVSSAALVAHRVDAMRFAAAVFTNLGRDHLGEVHPTMEAYFEAKAQLFAPELSAIAIVNGDDEYGRRLRGSTDVATEVFLMHDAENLAINAQRESLRLER